MNTNKRLILPLMMFGKDGNKWHIEGEPVREKVIVDYTEYTSGKKKGMKKPIYAWVEKTKKKKVVVGYDGVYTRGKNKGKPKEVYETKEVPVMSTGWYPSVNHIYLNAKFSGGGGRRLKPIAENHLRIWREKAEDWREEVGFVTGEAPHKVAIDMYYFLPKGLKDTHNSKKLLLDALEGVVHTNDYYMLDRTIDFTVDEEDPRIEMEIYYLSADR